MQDNNPPDLLPADRFSSRQLGIVFFCILVAMVDGFDIMLVPYTAPAIAAEWGASSERIGLLFSAGLFGMALGAMFLGFLADVYGRRAVISIAVASAGLFTLLGAYADSVTQLIGLRLLAGVGLGLMLAPLASMVAEFSPLNFRNLTVAISMASISVGSVLGGLAVSAVIGDFGWRAIFLYGGLLSVVGGAAFYLLVPESPSYIAEKYPRDGLDRINHALTKLGHRKLESMPPKSTTVPESATLGALLIPSRRGTTLLAWSAFFLSFSVLYFIASWMPKILVIGGLSQEDAIRGTALVTFGGIVGTALVGWLSRWRPLNFCIVTFFLLGSGLLLFFSAIVETISLQPQLLLAAVLFLLGVTITGGFANLYTVAVIIYPPHIRSTGIGWCVGLGRFGAVISPALAGVLMGMGVTLSHMFIYAVVPAVMAMVATWFIKLKQLD